MAEFILVHGAWHGAWCWREIVPRLNARGHRATAIDLPGHGEDRTPADTVTLQNYVNRIIEAVDASERPLLVGHSMGVISQAAERVPDRIRAQVYLSGLLPPNGSSMLQQVAGFDPEYLAQIEWAPDRRTARLSAAGFRNFCCNCCPPAVVEAAYPLLTPQSVEPFETPFSITPEIPGQAPRFYIESLRDRIIPIALQRDIQAGLTFRSVYSIDTDHAAFFSAPDELSAILHNVAEQI